MMSPDQKESNTTQVSSRQAEIIMLLSAILPVWLSQLGSIKNQTEDAVNQLADSVSSIVGQFDKTDVSNTPEQSVRSDIESLLLGLQYQDRINQTLSVVINDMARLQHIITTNTGQLPTADEWLNELSSRYTMPDERSHHQQAVLNNNGRNTQPNSDEVIFF